MAILITHGYLLTGTGSNLYVNNLVRELVKKGEEVFLFCQDFDPLAIDFVNELYEFDESNTTLIPKGSKESPFPGKCICYKPNLGGFLPVYVYDHYEGYEVKEFNSCSDDEVARYVAQNKAAMNTVMSARDVSVVNTNHLVMVPYVASLLKADHDFKFVITVHGSALNFTVKKDKRFEDFAIESLKAVDDIVVDSLHADEEMKEFLEEVGMEDLIAKMSIIPAGVDISSFDVDTKGRAALKEAFVQSVSANVSGSEGRTAEQNVSALYDEITVESIEGQVKNLRGAYDYRQIDADAISKIEQLHINDNNVFFVGKYLWTKGIYLLLLAIPEILKKNPNTNFIIAGFGPFREPAEVILNCLAQGKIQLLREIIQSGDLFEGEEGQVIPLINEILDKHGASLESTVSSMDIEIRDKVIFTGILNHAQLVNLLPAMDVLVAASVFPEAFGMVAIEAAACGVYPVVTYQSAFKEIADEVKALVKDELAIQDVLLDLDAASNIAMNANEFLSFKDKAEAGEMAAMKAKLRKLVVDNFSWEGIANKYLNCFEK